MTQTHSATLPDITELHVHFLAILPTIEQYAELAHRHLVNFHDREDAVADTVAAAWERFLQLAEQDAHQLFQPPLWSLILSKMSWEAASASPQTVTSPRIPKQPRCKGSSVTIKRSARCRLQII